MISKAFLAAVTAACLLWALPSSAFAHSSDFCGHYTLDGRYWQVAYYSPSNYQGTHYHFVDHSYRPGPGYLYQYRHEYPHPCGQYYNGPHVESGGPTEGVFVPDAVAVDADEPADIAGVDFGSRLLAVEVMENCIGGNTIDPNRPGIKACITQGVKDRRNSPDVITRIPHL